MKGLKQVRLFGGEEPTILSKLELEKAEILAKEITDDIQNLCQKLAVVGSIRRQKSLVGDIDFVVLVNDVNWRSIIRTLKKSIPICSGQNLIKLNYPVNEYLFQIDFYRAQPSTFGINQLIRTGSADHNMWLAGYAFSKGFRIKYSEGLLKDDIIVAGETEESVFEMLGLTCPQPTEREVIDGKPVWQN